ncbi:MAG: thrombospondin type 3 repeat-containing protein [Candidatus Hodarchaeales archaeon]|jgi:hypothetical protein
MGKRTTIVFLLLTTIFIFNMMDSGHSIDSLEEYVDFDLYNVEKKMSAKYVFLQSPLNNSIIPSETPIVFEITDSLLLRVDFNWDYQPNITWLPPYITLLPPNEGIHILHVYALDTLDIWEYQKFHFTSDDTIPIIELGSTINSSQQIPEAPIDLIINDTNLDRVLYHWNVEENQSLFFPYQVNLPREDGLHQLSVYAYDLAGNWGKKRFQFTVRMEISPDSDNDGLSDYIEFLLGSDPNEMTDQIGDAPIVFDDLNRDVPDNLLNVLFSHTHISAQTWILGTVNEKGFEDQTDYYIFTSEIRTTGSVFIQSNLPGTQAHIFDLEGRVNFTSDVILDRLNSGRGAEISTGTNFVSNPLPYIVEIPIPLAVELLVIQIKGGFAGNSLYSIWIEDAPIQAHMEVLSLLISLLLFIGLPFMFFLILRWENHRSTKKQRKTQEKLEFDSEFVADNKRSDRTPPIVNVRFSEWVFSSFFLFILVLLFTELSREKFQNQVTILTAKGFVDLGYRIFFLAVTLILLGGILSVISRIKVRLKGQKLAKDSIPLFRRLVNLGVKVGIILSVYFILWILFIRFIGSVNSYFSSSSSLSNIIDILQAFFISDISTTPTLDQFTLLTNMGLLELVFLVFTLPLALYMFILNFAGGTSVRKVFRPVEQRKSRWNFKTLILGIGLSIEIYRIFSNLINFLISILFSENPTFFFIQISELPWWHQVVTWISQETLISTPVLYGLYFELQGIFFAWVIYTSLPRFFRRFMSGSGYSKSITRIGFFLLGMFVIFLRTLHLLLLVPVGVPSFPFSVILTDPFSILLLIAMISEVIEILGFSLGLLLIIYLRKIQKQSQKEDFLSVQPIQKEEEVVSSPIESSFVFQLEEE